MSKRKAVEVHCCFEEWDRENHRMGHCHDVATHHIGNKKVCKFHADYAMSIRDRLPGNHDTRARLLEKAK
jgi:hypothetical protein